DPLLGQQAARRGGAPAGTRRPGRGQAEVRRGARLPAVGPEGAGHPGLLADAGVLEDQLPARADLAPLAAHTVLQRQRVRRLGAGWARAGTVLGGSAAGGRVLPPEPGSCREAEVRAPGL